MWSDGNTWCWCIVLLAAGYCRLPSVVGEQCTVDAAGTRGDCKRIFQCPILQELFMSAKNANRHSIAKLRALNNKCKHLSDFLVCCQNERTRTRLTPPSDSPPTSIVGSVPSESPRTPTALPTDRECGTFTSPPRIVNGFDASIGEFPWMASIQYSINGQTDLVHGCGGTLITSRHVLTAGHCVSFIEPIPKTVILGELDFDSEEDCFKNDPTSCSDPPKTFEIAAIRSHERFENIRQLALPNDIAIIKLTEEVTFTDFIRPICLLRNTSVLGRGSDVSDQKVNMTLTIAGWGQSIAKLDSMRFTPLLQFGRVHVHNIQNCEELFQRRQPLLHLTCAGGLVNQTDTCRGDSGGPLMAPVNAGFQWYQLGISSFGAQDCGHLAAYTRVLDYIDWIEKTIREL